MRLSIIIVNWELGTGLQMHISLVCTACLLVAPNVVVSFFAAIGLLLGAVLHPCCSQPAPNLHISILIDKSHSTVVHVILPSRPRHSQFLFAVYSRLKFELKATEFLLRDSCFVVHTIGKVEIAIWMYIVTEQDTWLHRKHCTSFSN